MIDKIQEYNLLGWATFPTSKKIPPAGLNWKDIEPDAMQNFEERYSSGEYALILRSTDLIVDIDPRNFPAGRNVWKEFKKEYELELVDQDAYVVQTGGGGYHIYLSKPEGALVRKHIKDWPGIDFLTGDKGAYVIGPGSKHESGGTYKVVRGTPAMIPAAPQKLLDVIKKEDVPKEIEDAGKVLDFSDDEQNIARYREYLVERALPAVEGQAGDQTTFKIACRGRDFRLSPAKCLEMMLDYYNPKCVPPWEPENLRQKVSNAYKYNEAPVGQKAPEMVFNEVKPDNQEEYSAIYDGATMWQLNKDGSPKGTLQNAVGYLSVWKELTDCMRYNELSHEIEITGKLPWHQKRPRSKTWTDEDTIHCKYYAAVKTKTEFPTVTIGDSAFIVASKRAYNPIKEYLSHLKWDGQKRLDDWLSTYCGSIPSDYVRTIARKTLVASVARIFNPGCSFHHVLILEGAQGIGKSYCVSVLGGEWFGDIHIDPNSKDTVDAMRGKWFIEMAEMEAVRGKKDLQALKGFVTRSEDRVRLAYARKSTDLPRMCVFIGTINPDGIGYFTDSTGNRRFWPVLCGNKVEIDALKRDRDQIFAEAVEAYRAGEELRITDKKVQQEAANIVEERLQTDPWVEIVAHWALNAGRDINVITTLSIYENVLNGLIKNITRADQIRIGRALTAAGWIRRRSSHGFDYYRDEKAMFPDVVTK